MTPPEGQRRLRIAIATLGRFHVLDLARELAALGHEVHFYSYVSRRRAERFGLARACHVALLPLLFPLVALSRMFRRGRARHWVDRALYVAANFAVRLRLRPCDVFISMSGMFLEASLHARRQFGARIVVERGSRHILSQRRILDEIRMMNPGCEDVPGWIVRRELAEYSSADLISVPSAHSKQSFADEGIEGARVFHNPYGVDLNMFYRSEAIATGEPFLLFVGTWSYQKGADLLIEAIRGLDLGMNLVHVGARGDVPLPEAEWFTSIGPVPQWELRDWYCRALALVLPSRQEGLALVQPQALACGCPVIASDRTGGSDLASYLEGFRMVETVPVGDVDALREAIRRRVLRGRSPVDTQGLRQRLAESLSWSSYGQRYSERLLNL